VIGPYSEEGSTKYLQNISNSFTVSKTSFRVYHHETVTRIYFQCTVGTRITILEILLNMQDFSSIRLVTGHLAQSEMSILQLCLPSLVHAKRSKTGKPSCHICPVFIGQPIWSRNYFCPKLNKGEIGYACPSKQKLNVLWIQNVFSVRLREMINQIFEKILIVFVNCNWICFQPISHTSEIPCLAIFFFVFLISLTPSLYTLEQICC
jgi:hypothetical protein